MAEVEQKFKVGDIVVLKSDSPKMTVSKLDMKLRIGGTNSGKFDLFTGKLECQWFVDTRLENGVFDQDSLKLFDE